MRGSFSSRLTHGRIGEQAVLKWLRYMNRVVLPVCDTLINIEFRERCGPRLFVGNDALTAPDLLVFADDGVRWMEIKCKKYCTWYRNESLWMTGIDVRHFEQYIKVHQATCIHVDLVLYHPNETPRPKDVPHGCPEYAPRGVYCADILKLQEIYHHIGTDLDGNEMIYWDMQVLQPFLIAGTVEIEHACRIMDERFAETSTIVRSTEPFDVAPGF